jgi:sulfur relay (sulfurtransferase) DsrF/TusC family protein
MIEIGSPSIEQIDACWDIIVPLIEKGVNYSHGELTSALVYQKLMNRELTLLVAFEDKAVIAALTLEQFEFETGKRVLNIQLAGGEGLSKWFHQMDQIINDIAKQYNCSQVYIIGRRGWVRALSSLGYNEAHTVLHKEVK